VSEYPQVVYFIQQGESGPIKIGTTVFALLDGRLKRLQTGSPYPLRLLGVVEGSYDLERRLHEQFSACRLEGEWFRADASLLQFVRANARQPTEISYNNTSQAQSPGTGARYQGSPGTGLIPMARSLSALESRLILHLEAEKQMVVTVEQGMDILGCSYDHARKVMHQLARRHWLARIRPGKYELIPAERGEHPLPDSNPLFIGSTLVEPYYFSFATAAFFHGLSTQASATVYLATSVRTGRRLYQVRGKKYRLVFQQPLKFFGAVEVDAYGSHVRMAEPEKAVVDALDRPEYAGDVPEIAGMLWRGQGRLDWGKLADYGLRFESQALIQRLGYLIDRLRLPGAEQARDRLVAAIGKSTPYLGRPGLWGTGGEYDATWQIVDNLPSQELMSEIEIV
jgi:predicted transcriptional regulator of viral defense system